eukprot:246082_1
MSKIQCICGNALILTTVEIYGSNKIVYCDNCQRILKRSDVIFHCDKHENENGYDLCYECCLFQKLLGFKQLMVCNNEIKDCCHVQRLLMILSEYYDGKYQNMIVHSSEYVNILDILDDFLHIIHHHVTDAEFEFIFHQFSNCNINECDFYRRNNRNRNEEKVNHDEHSMNDKQVFEMVCNQIIDRIHCYFCHCYDVGYRVLLKDQEQKTYMNTRMAKKYSQLQQYQNKIDALSTDNIYSIGIKFIYGYPEELRSNANKQHFICIDPKYSNLKQELTANKICTINFAQYIHEYNKAAVHHKSYYKKSNANWENMKIPHILCLMIYCNYTELQSQFSKTYRQNKGSQHIEFFYLGMCLKMAVNQFGTHCAKQTQYIFYHGIGERLVFPEYVHQIYINCPLSTSISFAVASNFAGSGDGLVIQLNGNTAASSSHGPLLSPIYFSVEWLSDFGNEKEYLFIQNNCGTRGLHIVDIHDFSNNCNYEIMLIALKQIDNFLSNGQFVSVGKPMYLLIEHIILNQLSYTFNTCPTFKSLNEYAQKMCRAFFRGRKCIRLSYSQYIQNFQQLFKVLFDKKYECIQFEAVHALCSNVEFIHVSGIHLCKVIMDEICNVLSTNSKLKRVHISVSDDNKSSELSIKQVVEQYTQRLKKLNVWVRGINDVLIEMKKTVNQDVVYSAIVGIWMEMNVSFMYYNDINNETQQLIYKLVKNELYPQDTNSINPQQQLFHDFCQYKAVVQINYPNIKLHPHLFAFSMLFHSDYDWVKIELWNKLFPNMYTFTMYGNFTINLCPKILDDILMLFSQNKTKLREIRLFDVTKGSVLSVSEAVSKYEAVFKSINFDIKTKDYNNTIIFEKHTEKTEWIHGVEIKKNQQLYQQVDKFFQSHVQDH